MMEYINNYSVVVLSEEDCSMICKNDKVDETIQYIVDKYNVSEEDKECIYSTSLEEYLTGGWFEGIEPFAEGMIFNERVELWNEQVIGIFVDCINEYLPESDIEKMIKENKTDIYETIYKLIDECGKALLIDELQSMIDNLK